MNEQRAWRMISIMGRGITNNPPHLAQVMPGNKTSITKAQRTMTLVVPAGVSYIDIAQCLSITNRKLFRQGMVYGIESLEFTYGAPAAALDTVKVDVSVAGDTWSVHNAHVKGEALWNEMNDLVLEDNPSVQGKWHDYKVFLDGAHRTNLISAGIPNLTPQTYLGGEWEYSDYVMPQHDVDPATGVPLVADQTNCHLLGDDIGGPGSFSSVGLVKAYAESRATVSPDQPNVPGGMPTSFFNLLTDSGSQEPELALVIEAENDNPPYDLNNYPGGDLNAPDPIIAEFGAATIGSPIGILTSFIAQCGLIRINNQGLLDGAPVASDTLTVILTVMAGKYKGIAAIPMGQ